eukprot:TRINITY_DN35065_c0_g1_i1.p1 TRINITY_DN35065_c0_g1~~TRINITY_DN35065_c0_g1_i1.p1  ORF type:complete len:545 (+),score=55.37 TRINITY_DN35065_c0_g1_i1:45-1679(+)
MSMGDIEDAFGDVPGRVQNQMCGNEVIAKVPKSRKGKREKAFGYDIPGTQTVYLKTYGCSHNFSDSEYMAGQLVAYGYGITEDFDAADVFVLNSCTVKNPSETHFINLVNKAKSTKKPIVVAGCVPQGDQQNSAWSGVSVIGVQQINRVVEVVEDALRGNTVQLFSRNKRNRPGLDLPKVRRNPWIEIIPINVGCLNQCTYCKTKHARGHLGSWSVEEIKERVEQVVGEGVKEIRLTSEDTGAYGRDIGTDIAQLLRALVEVIPDGVMLKIGMTNPPYMLEHLDAIAEILNHPRVYSFMHIPVQAASNRILSEMKREYTIEEFELVVDTLREKVPFVSISTDIICGFPTETEEEFEETMQLCKKYEFAVLNISQFYPRRDTPAAAMKQLPSEVKKDRSRRLTTFFESYTCYDHMVGTVQRVWITEHAHDGFHLVGHTKNYVQVLVKPDEGEIGHDGMFEIVEASRWSVKGKRVKTETEVAGKQEKQKEAQWFSEGKQAKHQKAVETPTIPTEPAQQKKTWNQLFVWAFLLLLSVVLAELVSRMF